MYTLIKGETQRELNGSAGMRCRTPICLVLFPVTDEGYTLGDAANDGQLNFDGLDINQ